MTSRYAAIDVGTNSVRLLVADVVGEGREARVTPVERLLRITRLGQGVDATRALHPDAIGRTLDALGEYADAMRSLSVERIRITATSAARDATNRGEFFGPAQKLLGVEPELLSGEEEARLSFLGATIDVLAPSPYLVVDIGGGSTEFILGTDAPEQLVSVNVGCVRFTEQYLHSDPPAPEELSQAIDVARAHLTDVEQAIPGARNAATLIGLAGTVTTVAAIEQGLAVYDADKLHHFRLTKDAIEDVFRTLATESIEQRRHNPGLEPGRVDVIVGGCVILVSIMRHLGFDELLVSESDILDGLVRSQTMT